MNKTNSGLMYGMPCERPSQEGIQAARDSRYTQEGCCDDYVRSHDQLKKAQIRKPRLNEGVSFREKI